MANAKRQLARKLNRPPASTRNSPSSPWVVGTVNTVSLSTGTLTVTIQGDTMQIPGISYLDSYTPIVGDTVILVRLKNHLWAIGTVAAYSGGAGSGWQVPALFSGVTTGTGSPGPVMWRIVGDNGSLKVQIKGGVNISGGGSNINLWTFGSGGAATPAYTRIMPIVGAGAIFENLTIAASSGNVQIQGSAPTAVWLDGIEYFIN